MSRNALCHETKVALNDRSGSFFDRPLAYIGEDFVANGSLLCGLRGSPPLFPTFGELFDERSLDVCALYTDVRLGTKINEKTNTRTLKAGLSSAETEETRAAARKAGSATLRIVDDTKDQDE